MTMKRRHFLISSLVATIATVSTSTDTIADFLGDGSALAPTGRSCCPSTSPARLEVPMPSVRALTVGNQQAMELARTSRRVMQANDASLALASLLADEL